MADPIKAFVCGHPIAHSRSPKIHGHWLTKLNIPGSYEAIDVSPDALPTFIGSLRGSGFIGGNFTIPHKEKIIPLLDEIDDSAKAIGAVNTVWMDRDRLCGGNTDAYGFVANLDANAPGWDNGNVAIVLGAGGAARAIVYALRTRGFERIYILNRSLERAEELAHAFDCVGMAFSTFAEIADQGDLLVNTTSLGMTGQPALNLNIEALSANCVVNDIVYVPLKTDLLLQAERRGLRTVGGLGMLLHQAVPGFKRWFGREPEVTVELYEAVAGDVKRMT